jgi:hypothetical protein
MNARSFTFDLPFVAQHDFVHDGETVKAGAPFDWRALGLSERDVWNLWCAYYIVNSTVEALTQVVPLPTPPKQQGRAARR